MNNKKSKYRHKLLEPLDKQLAEPAVTHVFDI